MSSRPLSGLLPFLLLLLLLPSLVPMGCAVGFGTSDAVPGIDAEVLALSTYEASLGTPIELYGTGFPPMDEGRMEVVFEGTFVRDDMVRESVSFSSPVRRVDAGTLRWGGFGPYRVPFGDTGDHTGSFEGTVRPRLVQPDGTTLDGREGTVLALRVLPSILVQDLQPLTASCGEPAVRGLGGLPYHMQVEAMGFSPAAFTYTLSAPALGMEPDALRHVATGTTDSLGDDGSFVLPQVPADLLSYSAIVSVEARATDGATYQSIFAISVHRPLEVFYNGNVGIAEVFAPVPVSGCIPGGEAGRDVDYTESTSETRTRGYNLSWNDSWLSAHTDTTSRSSSTTATRSNSVGFSTTDGQSFNWSVGAEASGGFSIGGLVEVGLKVNGSVGGETTHSDTQSTNSTAGLSQTETTTDTRSDTETTGHGEGQEFQWQVSSTEQLARGFSGTVIAGTYGVFYRQTVRLSRHAALVTYNLCGVADVVGDVDFEDWTWSTDLGLGQSCPPLPASNLPEAQCLEEPCEGE